MKPIITEKLHLYMKKSEIKVLGNFPLNYHPNLCSSHLSLVPSIMLALHDQQAFLKPMKNSGVVFSKVLDTFLNTSMN